MWDAMSSRVGCSRQRFCAMGLRLCESIHVGVAASRQRQSSCAPSRPPVLAWQDIVSCHILVFCWRFAQLACRHCLAGKRCHNVHGPTFRARCHRGTMPCARRIELGAAFNIQLRAACWHSFALAMSGVNAVLTALPHSSSLPCFVPFLRRYALGAAAAALRARQALRLSSSRCPQRRQALRLRACLLCLQLFLQLLALLLPSEHSLCA